MADTPKPLSNIEQLTQDIIDKFETALNTSTTSELSSLVNNINQTLEKQASLIQNIFLNSTDRLKQTRSESETVKETTEEIIKQSKLYKNILATNDDITDNWDQIIKKSASADKNYKDLNKQQKDYLTSLNLSIKKEKQLTDLTYKRLKAVAKANKTAGKGGRTASKSGSGGGMPQFVNTYGLASSQMALEASTGGRPYFASHPEMGVPMGLFNTKDEPNSNARIKAIEKYGPYGSVAGLYPQYAKEDLPVVNPSFDVDPDSAAAIGILLGKIVLQKLSPILDYIVEIVDIVTKLGDKFQEYAGEADEAIRSAIQGSGTMMASSWADMFKGGTPIARASYFQQSMEKAAWELNVDEGVYASYEMLSNLQKAFTQYSKTNVLLGKDDLKNMIYVQQTFDIAADDVADIQSAFMDIGMSSQDMIKYTNDLAKEARQYGVSATQLLKDSAKLMRAGVQYRFKGGVSDFQKMQVYAANAKFDIEKAYTVMDKSLSIEGAIDLASQLQVLGGEFSDISSTELFAAAQSGDMESFTKSIIERFKKDVGRFGSIGDNGMFEFTPTGRLLLKAFQNIEGFDLGDDLQNILTKAGKEAKVREQILGGRNATNFLTKFSEEEQRKIVENIAQGSVKELNLTGQELKSNLNNDLIDFNKYVLDRAADMTVGKETAKGLQSAKDEADLNTQLVKLESQQVEALVGLKDGLINLKENLMFAGESIFLVGQEYFKSPFFKKMEVLTDYLGVTLEEAILFHEYFEKGADGVNKYAAMMKALMKCVEDPVGCMDGGPVDAIMQARQEKEKFADEYEKETGGRGPMSSVMHEEAVNPVWVWQKHGGLLEAAGGMVIGPSHSAGGVRGSGNFNNVEVEGGEAIINKKSTQMFLPLLSKLNELGGGVKFNDSSGQMEFLNDTKSGDKTINIKISGGLDLRNKTHAGVLNYYEIAEGVDALTNGKSYGGVY